jgi:hypothetical protein
MINIRIIGSTPPCIRNKMMEQRANDVALKYPGKVVVTRIAALSKEGRKYKTASIPVVLVNDKAIATGQAISEHELEKTIKEKLEVQAWRKRGS